MKLFKSNNGDDNSQWVEDLLDSMEEQVIITDKKKCQLLFANAKARNKLGVDLSDEDIRCRDAIGNFYKNICNKCPALAEEKTSGYSFDIVGADDRVYSVNAADSLWEGRYNSQTLYIKDVDEQRKNIERLEHLAFLDTLTGIPNRRKFLEDFAAIEKQISGGKLTGILCIMDLDNFKSVNDTYGHNTGDLMLKEFVNYCIGLIDGKGTFYRLGGDEFLMVFNRPANGKDATVAEYDDAIKGIFRSYTLSNIETYCTVSMGIALFPKHGSDTSELLRKADIALYRAKAAGKNKLVEFVDTYDTAKRFVDIYVHILPILNTINKTVGYELVESSALSIKDESSDIMAFSSLDKTLDILGMDELTSDAKIFIGYNEQLLSPLVLQNLSKTNFVIEISEKIWSNINMLPKVVQLHKHGCQIAIDNYSADSTDKKWLDVADILKVDISKTAEGDARNIARIRSNKQLIATKVDTNEMMETAKNWGYKLFQGYYFSEPKMVKTKDIEPLRANYLMLLKIANAPGDLDFRAIAAIIENDVALSYKLLKLLNSAAIGLRYKITSIELAVAYLGEEELKKWITLLAIRGVSADRPLEIIRISLIRAYFGELLSPLLTPQLNKKTTFLLGLLSLMDVALNMPFSEVFKEISVDEVIMESLCSPEGELRFMLDFFKNYEYGNWDYVTKFADKYLLNSQSITDKYLEAVQWYNDLIKDLD